MSCIVGIFNLDGAPVDSELLERMTGTMKSRAPDESNVWVSGNVGFGHAMLRVSPESDNEHQPCTLDNQVWITADARIDGRVELIAKLRSQGARVENAAPDVELILHAYAAFGENFLDHLIGDFAFALWDGREKKLICARDHFGVRPFFYAVTGKLFLFASTVEALLQCASLSGQLDETAVADFLLFGTYLESETTIYSHVRRLAAAHILEVNAGSTPKVRRYWELSQPPDIRYKNDGDYLEHFQAIFKLSVADRLRATQVAAQFSGGMDSTSVVALAREVGCEVTAFVSTVSELIPEDDEGSFAKIAADYLAVRLEFQRNDDYSLFEGASRPELATDEPTANTLVAAHYDNYLRVLGLGNWVLLTGQGGDAVFAGSRDYYPSLLRRGLIHRLLGDVYRHVRATGSLAGLGLRAAFRKPEVMPWEPRMPGWVNRDFARRVNIEERWALGWQIMRAPNGPQDQLNAKWVSGMFDQYRILKLPVEARHPYYDLRLVNYLLGLPTYVKTGKKILRDAMRGRLPESIRLRPKTGMAGDPVRVRLASGMIKVPDEFRLSLVGEYVDPRSYWEACREFQQGQGEETTWNSSYITNPAALNIWLVSLV